jgi:hypothetical protein
LYNEKRRISRKDGFPTFSIHVDDSMGQNGNKISEKLAKRSIERAPHRPYSPDISPCDFWLFGMLKHNMKDREFQSQQAILSVVAKMWNDLTFADVQCVFQDFLDTLYLEQDRRELFSIYVPTIKSADSDHQSFISLKYFNDFLIPQCPSKIRTPGSSLRYFLDQHWQEIAAIAKCAFDRKWSRKWVERSANQCWSRKYVKRNCGIKMEGKQATRRHRAVRGGRKPLKYFTDS